MTSSQPLLVIIGPPGDGRSKAARLLVNRGLLRVHPVWTTRPRRPDEHFGTPEHRFVDDTTFDALVAAGFFLDAVALFGLPHRYGLPPIRRPDDHRVDTIMLRAPLVPAFKRVVADPTVVVQIEDDPRQVADRLHRQAGTALELRCRLADNERETTAGRAVADRVLVHDGTLDELTEGLADVVGTLRSVCA
jgi:guanylate kinase